MAHHLGWDPARVELLWGERRTSTRGPKPSLSVEQIVRAAIELADAEGLDAVSMKRVAEQLGVGTMSLYTYVPDKAALLELLLDAAGSDFPEYAGEGWRTYLERMAWAILEAYRRHPWALQIVISGPPVGPNQLDLIESALRALDETGLDDQEMHDGVMTLFFFVRGAAHIVVGLSDTARRSGLSDAELGSAYGEIYRKILDPERFPLLLRAMTGAGSADPGSRGDAAEQDFGFGFGVACILDGLEARIAARAP